MKQTINLKLNKPDPDDFVSIASLNANMDVLDDAVPKKADKTYVDNGLKGKAPTNHRSTGTGYGVGDATYYGHVKVDATPTNGSTNAVASNGVYDAVVGILPKVYPVGSIYISTVATNPHDLFGFGTWVPFAEGRVIVGEGTGYANGKTGGEATHKLTTTEMPGHTHTGTTSTTGAHTHKIGIGEYWNRNPGGSGCHMASPDQGKFNSREATAWLAREAGDHSHEFTTDSTGGNGAHNNMQPYIVAHIWKRTA